MLPLINFLWRGTIIIVPLFVLGWCALGFYRQFNPTFLLSPLDAQTLEHCHRGGRDTQCNLIPAFFGVGETLDEISRRMTASGYRHIEYHETSEVDGRQVAFTDAFIGPNGSTGLFACGYQLSINMRFDDSGRLEAAEGDTATACL